MAFGIGVAGALIQISCLLVIFGNGFVGGRPQDAASFTLVPSHKCGYQSCPEIQSKKLNVHLIPHTHNDVGWVNTVDQYYFDVKKIIDSVVQALLKDPTKRFIYVESSYFFLWWSKQTPQLQEQVKLLVNEGRLEFVGGAWSMNDEATTHYQSIIDQFTWGLRRLNDTFGECGRPRIGWQIDPFGHSREMASMFAQMGFDGLFFGRLDYQDKSNRQRAKTMEMIWHASANLKETSNLFTGVLYNLYHPPPGFCFDVLCYDSIKDDPVGPSYNVGSMVHSFVRFAKQQAMYYRTNNILITMGGDFTFQNATYSFANLDKLISYVNTQSDINLLYSTPSCYLKSLHNAGITWPLKDDDFFPYASDAHTYWTGYYTSRPTLKRYEREGNHFLQVCKELTALVPTNYAELTPQLTLLRETMGIMQHHDAVTGTEQQHVANDYAQRMAEAFDACGLNTCAILNFLATGNEPNLTHVESDEEESCGHWKFDFQSCPLLNISSCAISEEADQFILTLYNPLARSTFEYVRIPVPDVNYEVKDYKGVTMEIQFVPIPEAVQELSFRESAAQYELIFLASDLPALGYKSYYISATNDSYMPPEPDLIYANSSATIGNEHIKLTFDANGFLSTVRADNQSRIIGQEFLYYQGTRRNAVAGSGAYIFRPFLNRVFAFNSVKNFTVYRGLLVEEVHQVFNEWVSQVVRVYRQSQYAEFVWLVGPIPVKDLRGKEIVSRFTSDIQSKNIFFTDSNGREMIKRTRNHRDTWKLNLQEHISGNYYPITTKIALKDRTMRLAILTDRAQGGSSLRDGALELMVHRRLLYDDGFGVVEPLNETSYGQGLVARGTHYLVMGKSDKSQSPTTEALERFTQLEKLLPTWKFFTDAQTVPYEEWQERYTNIFTGLSLSLPKQVHLLTFEPWRENEILVRFEHIFEKGEDPEYSKVARFNLMDGLGNLKIISIRETTLAGNAWLHNHRRLQFIEHGRSVPRSSFNYQQMRVKKSVDDIFFESLSGISNSTKPIAPIWIELEPMQIRTFVLTVMKAI